MHGIACITGQEIILLHHCELNTATASSSSSSSLESNVAAQHVHFNGLYRPITRMFSNTNAIETGTGKSEDNEDNNGGSGGDDNDFEEDMLWKNVFTLGCTVRINDSTSVVELKGFPWWRSDARFRVHQKKNDAVIPLHHHDNEHTSNCMVFEEESHAIGNNAQTNGYRPTLIHHPQGIISSILDLQIDRDESITTVNGTYTNGAMIMNGQSHKSASIRVESVAVIAPILLPKQSRKASDDGLLSSKDKVSQKKNKKMRLH